MILEHLRGEELYSPGMILGWLELLFFLMGRYLFRIELLAVGLSLLDFLEDVDLLLYVGEQRSVESLDYKGLCTFDEKSRA